MDQLIEELYKDAFIMEDIEELAWQSALNNGRLISNAWNKASKRIADLIARLGKVDLPLSQQFLEAWRETGEGETDFRRLTCNAEVLLKPIFLEAMKKLYGDINVPAGRWMLERSAVGFFTIKDTISERYLHSPWDPMQEALLLARKIYTADMQEIHILGCGLGYLVYQLWKCSEESLKIHVYEDDEMMVELAYRFGVLEWIATDSIIIHTKADKEDLLKGFLHSVQEGCNYYICDWKQGEYADSSYGNTVDQLNYAGRMDRMFGDLITINRRENLKSNYLVVDRLKKDLYISERTGFAIVSSGPSLNDNIDFLKLNRSNLFIIAVNSCLKRLFSEGIIPDMIAMLDPQKVLETHIEGVEQNTEGIPLVSVTTASRQFINKYRGKIYFVDKTENECSYEWSFDGTVSSMALDVAYYMGAKRIYLIGSDLALPGGVNYADGLVYREKDGINPNKKNGVYVESIDGKMIPSNIVYNAYRGIIEKQIEKHDAEVYNMSKHGALIKGAISYYGEARW